MPFVTHIYTHTHRAQVVLLRLLHMLFTRFQYTLFAPCCRHRTQHTYLVKNTGLCFNTQNYTAVVVIFPFAQNCFIFCFFSYWTCPSICQLYKMLCLNDSTLLRNTAGGSETSSGIARKGDSVSVQYHVVKQ